MKHNPDGEDKVKATNSQPIHSVKLNRKSVVDGTRSKVSQLGDVRITSSEQVKVSYGKTHVMTYSEALRSPPQLKSNPFSSQTVQQSQFSSGANTNQPLVHHQGSHGVGPSKISTLPLSQLPLSQISQDASQSQFIWRRGEGCSHRCLVTLTLTLVDVLFKLWSQTNLSVKTFLVHKAPSIQ